ncbi:hypothetical protein Gotri_022743, partial [Gossypium trilobum]|nr:hypothetical protein [Gossypium trilobum]
YEGIFGWFADSSWEEGGLRGQFEEGVHIDILSPLKRNKKISLLKGDVSLWATTRWANPPISIWLCEEDKVSSPILEEIMHDKGEGISSDDEIAESQDVGLDEMGFDTKENPIRSRDGAPVVMKLLSWNICGLGSLWFVRRLQHALKNFNPQLVFLFEQNLMTKEWLVFRGDVGISMGLM